MSTPAVSAGALPEARPVRLERLGKTTLLALLFRFSGGRFTLSVLTGLVAGAAGTVLITLINRALNPGEDLGRLALAFIGVGVTLVTTRGLSQLMLGQIGQACVYELRMLVCRRVVDAPLRRLEELGPARLSGTLNEDLDVITNATVSLPMSFIDLALSIGCFAYQAWLSWRLFAVTFVLILAWTAFNYWLPVAAMQRALTRARSASDVLFDHYRGVIEGVKELKLNAARRKAYVEVSLGDAAAAVRKQNLTAVSAQSIAVSLQQLMYLGVIGVLIYGIARNAPLSTITGFIFTIHYLELSWGDTLSMVPLLTRAGVALKRIDALALELELETNAENPAAPVTARFQTLELRGVRQGYETDRKFELGPLDLKLSPGQVVIVAGGNGSGKTTFAKVLTGLYPPQAGEILIDGRPASDLAAYRMLFTAIFTDSYLFDRLPPNADAALVEAYLIKLKLRHEVEVRDGKLSTTALSTGQRRRLMLLMAWLEDRPIYLFDEWAADQDPEFRSTFYDDVLPELRRRGKLVVVISHDDRHFHVADRLLRLRDGQLSEDPVPRLPS